MKTKFIFAILLTLLFTIVETSAQVGIGTTTPQGALDITSTNDGLLIPRVALMLGANFPLPLSAPVNSEIIYNTATVGTAPNNVTPGFYFWRTSPAPARWVRFVTGDVALGWMTNGNSGLNAADNFLGTTDAVDVVFRRANTAAGRIGATSTSFGVNALATNTGANNTAFGVNALRLNTDKGDNTAIGYNALTANVGSTGDGTRNTAVGSGALATLNGGTLNTAVGFNALNSTGTLSQFNTAVGAFALRNSSNSATQDNVAVGYNALGNAGAIITGSVAIGANALISANSNTTRNIAIGYQAGSGITSGSDNIVIGANAQVSSPAGSGQIVIGGTLSTAFVNAASWAYSSDRRLKADIIDSPLGLDFIKTIRPVSYYRLADDNKKIEFGLIAQEIESSLNNVGITNSGILMKTADDMFAVRYNDFLPISIKAIQEQQEQIEELKKTNEELLKINREILKRLEALENK